ncbi:MAG: cytochrome c biogenesis protein CcsA [Bacteroidales bacterium]|nr:cytochrome c biogenesis protein CcsA [Bacteroidales bacterium]
MATATFIENDHGSRAAFELVYGSVWFEILMVLTMINLAGRLIIDRLYRKEKISVMLFHLAFIIIILGGGITRYFGEEGTIHLREGETKDYFLSHIPYLQAEVINDSGEVADQHHQAFSVTLITEDSYRHTFSLAGEKFTLEYQGYIEDATKIKPHAPRREDPMTDAMVFEITGPAEAQDIFLWMNDREVKPAAFSHDGHILRIDYGSRHISMPFSLQLKNFILERYPGSGTPSSFKSKLLLNDGRQDKHVQVSMNNVLKYQGYRIFQDSYDKDEKGSVLAVNHDPVGMIFTYTGYGILFLFIIISLLNPNSLFRKITAGRWKQTAIKSGLVLIILASGISGLQAQGWAPQEEVAHEFGKILVQDRNGRTKPIYTLSHEILRKVYRDDQYKGLGPVQVFMGIMFDSNRWLNEPLIKVSDENIREMAGLQGEYAAVSDLVNLQTGEYLLQQQVQAIYNKTPATRNKPDKKILKVDERLNIVTMIVRGDLLKIFPVEGDPHNWISPFEDSLHAPGVGDSVFMSGSMENIFMSVKSGKVKQAIQQIQKLKNYQREHAGYELPSSSKVQAEIFYHKSGFYGKLFPLYMTAGFLFLIILIYNLLHGQKPHRWTLILMIALMSAGLLVHTAGIGLRWYIAERAPLSNGYETMVFISWVAILAGLLYARRSPLALASTALLAGFTLMVARLSFMDPGITALMPVLNSYWLTLHVSVITASYAFLGMGAVLGLICLILFILIKPSNRDNILSTIRELTVINYKSLTLGLYMLTIGTFLGAIWANESWGRYWGWDPKETWSLISIIVYSFIIHSHKIQAFRSLFAFNTLALFGLSSILMTYFGVNYYLSGLHSYAGGDPVPVPAMLYFTVAALLILAFFARVKTNKL